MKKLTLLFLLLFLNVTLFAQDTYYRVETMPIFPTCDTIGIQNDIRKCTELELYKYVYKNIVYPLVAKRNGIEGLVVVRFTVTITGKIEDVQVIKGIGGGCDEELIRVIEEINEKFPKWTSGKINGRPLAVHYNFPMRFKLANHDSSDVLKYEGEFVYTFVENEPTFLICHEETNEINRRTCTEKQVIEYILNNFEYPIEDIDKRLKGVVKVEFVVTKSGEVIWIKYQNHIEHYCKMELNRVIQTMNNDSLNWKPAQLLGKPIHAKYTFSIDLKSLKPLKKAKIKELRRINKN